MPALLIEACELKTLYEQANQDPENNSNIIIVDVASEDRYQNVHLPGAQLVTPAETQAGPPIPGLAPSDENLTRIMQRIGLTPSAHVIVYDDEGGGWAGRFIWLLDEIGHKNYSYLNGGIHAWTADGFAVEKSSSSHLHSSLTSSDMQITNNHTNSLCLTDLLNELSSGDIQIWDARSPMEYRGETVYGARGGHIPGAKNYEWTRAMDKQRNLRLKPLDVIESELASIGITKDKKTVTHCQSHHRSGLTYLIAKLLDFKEIKAYAGSWGEWGNDPDTPIE